MHFSLSALVLGTLAAGSVSAASITHERFHGKRHNHAIRHSEMVKKSAEEVEKRDAATSLLTAADQSRLSTMNVLTGLNSQAASTSTSWVGTSGGAKWTNEFVNQAGEDLILVVWGKEGSWVQAAKPEVVVSIPAGQNKTVSFPDGWSGAWAPIYSTSKISGFGQISETWGEATFAGAYSTTDVSREVNMSGRNMKIVTPNCYSDMNTCVFMCGDGSTSCMTGYKLVNCAIGSQVGANFGTDPRWNADSGGCSGMGSSANLITYLGYK